MMPNGEKPERTQLNVRLDDEMKALLAELGPLANAATGLKVSQSDIVRLGLHALAREYRAKAETTKTKK